MNVVVRRLLAWTLAISMLTSGSVMGMADGQTTMLDQTTAQEIVASTTDGTTVGEPDGNQPAGSSNAEGEPDGNQPAGSSNAEGELDGNQPAGSSGVMLSVPKARAVDLSGAWINLTGTNIKLTVDDPITLSLGRSYGIPVTDSDGSRVAENLTPNKFTITPEDGVIIREDQNNNGAFFMWAGAALETTVTIKQVTINGAPTDITFKVKQDTALPLIEGTAVYPQLVKLSGASDDFTNETGTTHKSNKTGAINSSRKVGVAFIDVTRDLADPNMYGKTIEGFDGSTGVTFTVSDTTTYTNSAGVTFSDNATNTGNTNSRYWADFDSYQGVQWRESKLTATVTVNSKSYNAMPYTIQYGSYYEDAEGIPVGTSGTTSDGKGIIYIDELNKLIEEHAVPDSVAQNPNLNVPFLMLPSNAIVIANDLTSRDFNDYTIKVPSGKVIKMWADKGVATVYGRLVIEGAGNSRNYFEGLAFRGDDSTYLPEFKPLNTKLDIAIGGGVCQTMSTTVEYFDVGYDMTDGQKGTYGGTIRKCDVGIEMNHERSNEFEIYENTFKENGVALAISSDASKVHKLINLRLNKFIDNTTDITYDKDTSGGNKIYLIQNFFGSSVSGSRPAELKTAGGADNPNLQVYPFYTDDKMTTLGVDANAFVRGVPATLPVDTSVLKDGKAQIKLDASVLVGFSSSESTTIDIPMIAGGDMEAAPTAKWSFAKGDLKTTNMTMDLKITEDIAKFSGTVDEYQPISFAHHNALPGTATVSVKDTSGVNVAVGTSLYLYKIVGGRLAKQDEEPTYNNGMFTFKRDDCSDYIITDALVTSPPASSSSSSSSSNTNTGTVTSDDVSSKLDKLPAGGSLTVSVASSPNVSNEVFAMFAKNPDKALELKGDGFTWFFVGKDIGSMTGLSTFNASISNTSPNEAAVSKIAGSTNILNVYFAYHGKLPGKATVELSIPVKYRGMPLNLYYVNTKTGKLELISSGTTSFNDKAKFEFTHCSDYILTPEKLTATTPTSTTWANPETGGTSLMLYHAAMSAARALAAVLAVAR